LKKRRQCWAIREFSSRLRKTQGLAFEIGVALSFDHVLAYATPFFVIHVLNSYVAHGIDAKLATLTTGFFNNHL